MKVELGLPAGSWWKLVVEGSWALGELGLGEGTKTTPFSTLVTHKYKHITHAHTSN